MKKSKDKKTAHAKKQHSTKPHAVPPIVYPDARFTKTNVARPSLSNVIKEKEWVEYDKL